MLGLTLSLLQEEYPTTKTITKTNHKGNLYFIEKNYHNSTQLIEKYFVINRNRTHILLILHTHEFFLQI